MEDWPNPDRQQLSYDLESTGKGEQFAPSQLTIQVSFGKLAVTDRVETVEPELRLPGRLLWLSREASVIDAQGSYVNTAIEDTEQQTLFWLACTSASSALSYPP